MYNPSKWLSTALVTSSIVAATAVAQDYAAPPGSYNPGGNSAVSGIADCARRDVVIAIANANCNPADKTCICSKLDLITTINRIINTECSGDDLQSEFTRHYTFVSRNS